MAHKIDRSDLTSPKKVHKEGKETSVKVGTIEVDSDVRHSPEPAIGTMKVCHHTDLD